MIRLMLVGILLFGSVNGCGLIEKSQEIATWAVKGEDTRPAPIVEAGTSAIDAFFTVFAANPGLGSVTAGGIAAAGAAAAALTKRWRERPKPVTVVVPPVATPA
jgi:hypothetical protein